MSKCPVIWWRYCGCVDYQKALSWQLQCREALRQGVHPPFVFALEHPPVITLGRQKGRHLITATEEELRAKDIAVVETGRGGLATLHSPGQLVLYPILDLRALRLSVPDYVHSLEEGIIGWLRDFGIAGVREREFPGVWVQGQKIAALGLHLHQGLTHHGCAINIANDLRLFQLLAPCGIVGRGVAALSQFVEPPPLAQCARGLLARLARLWEVEAEEVEWGRLRL